MKCLKKTSHLTAFILDVGTMKEKTAKRKKTNTVITGNGMMVEGARRLGQALVKHTNMKKLILISKY